MMKKTFLFLILFLSQLCFSENWHSFKYNGLYGYLDENFDVKIEPKYLYADEYYGDWAIVSEIDGYKVLVDRGGNGHPLGVGDSVSLNLVCDGIYYAYRRNFLYDIKNNALFYSYRKIELDRPNFQDDFYFAFEIEGKGGFGYYNKNLEKLEMKNPIEAENWIRTYPMADGVAIVIPIGWKKNSLINKDGEIVIEKVHNFDFCFSEGLMPVWTDKQSGYINNKGEFVIATPLVPYPSEYEMQPPTFHYPCIEGVCVPQVKKGVWKIFTKTGKVLMDETEFFKCSVSSNGLILFQKKERGKFGYMSKKGRVVIGDVFDEAEDFKNGRAKVVYNGEDGILDTNGNFRYSSDLMNWEKEKKLNFWRK